MNVPVDYPLLPDPPRLLAPDELAALRQIRDRRILWLTMLENERMYGHIAESHERYLNLRVDRIVRQAGKHAQPLSSDGAMKRKDVTAVFLTNDQARRFQEHLLRANVRGDCMSCNKPYDYVQAAELSTLVWRKLDGTLEDERVIRCECPHCGVMLWFNASVIG